MNCIWWCHPLVWMDVPVCGWKGEICLQFLKKTSSKCCLHCSVSLSGQGIRGFTLEPAVPQHHEEGSVLIWYSERWANSLPTLLFVVTLLQVCWRHSWMWPEVLVALCVGWLPLRGLSVRLHPLRAGGQASSPRSQLASPQTKSADFKSAH